MCVKGVGGGGGSSCVCVQACIHNSKVASAVQNCINFVTPHKCYCQKLTIQCHVFWQVTVYQTGYVCYAILTHMDENAATANYGQYRPLEKLNGRESPRGSEGKTGRQAWLSLASLIGQFHHHGNSLAEGHIINSGRQAKAFLTTQPLHSPNWSPLP